jgi:protein-cysteine N-palmitoyltransferase HHAT
LYPGWLLGLPNDLSDIQWRTFRAGLPELTAALAVYTLVSSALSQRHMASGGVRYSTAHHAWRLAAGAALAFGLHGAYAIHVFAALALHFTLGWQLAGMRAVGPVAIWGFPAAVWLAARSYDGLPFSLLGSTAAQLDGFAGPVRWQIGFNLVLLRMISWGMDLHWTRLRRRGFAVQAGARMRTCVAANTCAILLMLDSQQARACFAACRCGL